MITLKARGGRRTFLCVPCRRTAKLTGGGTCPSCGRALLNMGTRWRPPRRSDRAAWRLLAAGEANTERGRVQPYRGQRPDPGYAFTSPEPSPPRDRWAKFRPVSKIVEQTLRELADGTMEPTGVRTQSVPVRTQVAAHPDTPIAVRQLLMKDKDADVRACAVANHPGPLRESDLLTLRRDRHPSVRAAVAGRDEATSRVLAKLLADKDPLVSRTAARHPNTRVANLLTVRLGNVPVNRFADLVDHAGVTDGQVAEALLCSLHGTQPDLPVKAALRVVSGALTAA